MNTFLGPIVTLQSSDIHGIHFLYGPGEDDDILWRHQDGAVVTWEMESGAYVLPPDQAAACAGQIPLGGDGGL